MPGLTIGDSVPDLELDTTHGKIRLHDYINGDYCIVFSHPADFTPVCTTELGMMAKYAPEFEKRGVKLLGLSCDDIDSHKEWIKDVEAYTSESQVTYPIAADPTREIIKLLNMVDPDLKDESGKVLPSRALHIVGPDKKVRASLLYPGSTGRNMDEVVRVVDSLQLAAKHRIATPVNWKAGEPVVVLPSVSDKEAKQMFGEIDVKELPSKRPYLRYVNVEHHR